MEPEQKWLKSLNIEKRFFWADEVHQQVILREIEFQREQGRIQGRKQLKRELKVKLLELLN